MSFFNDFKAFLGFGPEAPLRHELPPQGNNPFTDAADKILFTNAETFQRKGFDADLTLEFNDSTPAPPADQVFDHRGTEVECSDGHESHIVPRDIFFEEGGLHEDHPFSPEAAGFEAGWNRLPLLRQIRDIMDDGDWYTLAELSWATGAAEATCSARVRDFRKAKYGESQVDRRYAGKGIYQYRLTARPF